MHPHEINCVHLRCPTFAQMYECKGKNVQECAEQVRQAFRLLKEDKPLFLQVHPDVFKFLCNEHGQPYRQKVTILCGDITYVENPRPNPPGDVIEKTKAKLDTLNADPKRLLSAIASVTAFYEKSIQPHKCTCPVLMLCNQGCKCGGV